jgi:hypothetical protein
MLVYTKPLEKVSKHGMKPYKPLEKVSNQTLKKFDKTAG